MNTSPTLTADVLRKAADITEQIQDLQDTLAELLSGHDVQVAAPVYTSAAGTTAPPAAIAVNPPAVRAPKGNRRNLSPEARERIRKAQQTRWRTWRREQRAAARQPIGAQIPAAPAAPVPAAATPAPAAAPVPVAA